MKTYTSYVIRPSGLFDKNKPYSIYGFFVPNQAERIYSGTAEECYKELENIRTKEATA